MKKKIRKVLLRLVMAAALLAAPMGRAYASEDEYITISVEASDDNEGITYAIDSPDNFSPSNTFRIPAGTSHTIYVKDAAGNITSQTYTPPVADNTEVPDYTDYTDYTYTEYEESSGTEPGEDSSDSRTINIDLELGKSKDKIYEKKQDTPAETGEGSLYSKTFLDGTDSSEQVFYSVTTQEGDVFYLLIDQGQEQNNVYLLSQVTNQDLNALAADGGTSGGGNAGKKDDEEDSLLKALSGSGNEDAESSGGSAPKPSKGGINGNALIVLVIIAAGGGVYYYQKIYKTKKEQEMDAMDAADMEQFEAENEEEDEYDFDYDDVDKDEFLRELMAKDEAGYAAASTEEAAAGGWEQGKEAETAHEKYATSHIPEPDNESSRNVNEAADDIFGDGDGDAADDIFGDGIDEDGYDPELDGEEED